MYDNLCHINVTCDMWSVASRTKYSWQPTPLSLILALHLIIQWLAGHGVVKLSGFNWFSDAVASLTRVCQSVHLSLTVSSPVSQSLVLTQLCFHWPKTKLAVLQSVEKKKISHFRFLWQMLTVEESEILTISDLTHICCKFFDVAIYMLYPDSFFVKSLAVRKVFFPTLGWCLTNQSPGRW